MKYTFREFTIKELFDLVDKARIDLNPSYQRYFIWSSDDQRYLVDTILKGYPLPSFFLFLKPDGNYEMVDGQQRTKTIYRFIKGDITASRYFGKASFSNIDKGKFLEYKIPVVIIDSLISTDSLNEFYVLINKKGVHLNAAEVNKSEYSDTKFLKLANELLTYQNLINLNLFTDTASKRMNDRAYIEELLGYLILGVKDKRKSVDDTFKSDITDEEYGILEARFHQIIDIIEKLNQIKPISSTRYKQKNDFYSLFSFINENLFSDFELLEYQYRILLILDGVDREGRQFIRPSNDDCFALREYANNCVTQSNSKNARDRRMEFLNAVLKNTSIDHNDILLDILRYLSDIFKLDISLRRIGNYELLDIANLTL